MQDVGLHRRRRPAVARVEVGPEGLERAGVFEVGAELGEPRAAPWPLLAAPTPHKDCWGAIVLEHVGRLTRSFSPIIAAFQPLLVDPPG
jgi:hypothetical protein